MIGHYSKPAPLKSLTQEYRLRAQAVDAQNQTQLLASKLESLNDVIGKMRIRLDELTAEDSAISFAPIDAEVFIRNAQSNIWHYSAVHDLKGQNGTTVCGWNYGIHTADYSSALDHKRGYRYCNRCLPKRAATFKVHSSSATLSSSSESS